MTQTQKQNMTSIIGPSLMTAFFTQMLLLLEMYFIFHLTFCLQKWNYIILFSLLLHRLLKTFSSQMNSFFWNIKFIVSFLVICSSYFVCLLDINMFCYLSFLINLAGKVSTVISNYYFLLFFPVVCLPLFCWFLPWTSLIFPWKLMHFDF